MASFSIDYGAIRRIATGPDVKAFMRKAGEAAHRSIAAEMSKHRKTGAYIAGLQAPEIDGSNTVTIRSTDPKTLWLEDGTKPHDIVATVAQALFWPGAAHPVRRVRHPGTPAYHPMRNGLRNTRI